MSVNVGCTGAVRIIGENEFDYAGGSVVSVGDLNGDGRDDLLIGASGYNTNTGAAYVVSGALINPDTGVNISLSLANVAGSGVIRFVGENENDDTGMAVALGGDVNGDGTPDLLIGAYGYKAASDAGCLYVVSGKVVDFAAGGTNISLANANVSGSGIIRLVGEFNNDNAGEAMAPLGDLDGDGKDDFLVSSPQYMNNTGAAYVVSGALIHFRKGGVDVPLARANTPGSKIFRLVGENTNDNFGLALNVLPDLNGDGKPELGIGAPGYPKNGLQGAAYFISGAAINIGTTGASSMLVSVANNTGSGVIRYVGESDPEYFGFSVSSIADLNGDSVPEVIVGAVEYNGGGGRGATYVISGKQIDFTKGGSSVNANLASNMNTGVIRIVGEDIDDYSGNSVLGTSDFDGDGKPDIVIGADAYVHSAFVGATYVVSGSLIDFSAGGQSILLSNANVSGSGITRLIGEFNDDAFGTFVTSIDQVGASKTPGIISSAYGYPDGLFFGVTYVIQQIHCESSVTLSPSVTPNSLSKSVAASIPASKSVSVQPTHSKTTPPQPTPSHSKNPVTGTTKRTTSGAAVRTTSGSKATSTSGNKGTSTGTANKATTGSVRTNARRVVREVPAQQQQVEAVQENVRQGRGTSSSSSAQSLAAPFPLLADSGAQASPSNTILLTSSQGKVEDRSSTMMMSDISAISSAVPVQMMFGRVAWHVVNSAFQAVSGLFSSSEESTKEVDENVANIEQQVELGKVQSHIHALKSSLSSMSNGQNQQLVSWIIEAAEELENRVEVAKTLTLSSVCVSELMKDTLELEDSAVSVLSNSDIKQRVDFGGLGQAAVQVYQQNLAQQQQDLPLSLSN